MIELEELHREEKAAVRVGWLVPVQVRVPRRRVGAYIPATMVGRERVGFQTCKKMCGLG